MWADEALATEWHGKKGCGQPAAHLVHYGYAPFLTADSSLPAVLLAVVVLQFLGAVLVL